MTGRVWLAIGILGWTAVTWGGRIRLLTGAEQADPSNWVRIGGSILIGLVAAAVLVLAAGGQVERWVLTVFAIWSTVIWLRSLVTVWAGDDSMAFKLVHTVLAIGYAVLSYLALKTGWGVRSG